MIQNNYRVSGNLSWVLRLEGLMVFVASLFFYDHMTMESWKLFFLLFFLPDIGLLGYVGGNKLGSITYNILHTYVTPLSVSLLFSLLSLTAWYYIVVIWIAHIGFDRALGFGLKYATGFKHTHLGIIGNAKS